MNTFSRIFFVLTAFIICRTLAIPIVVSPGGSSDIIITSQDTVNETYAAANSSTPGPAKLAAATTLPISFVNNLSGGAVNAYVTGLDSNNRVVLLQPNGAWYYPPSSGATTPQPVSANVAIPLGGAGSTTSITLPGYLSAGRVWLAEGTLQFFIVDTSNGVSLVEPSAVNPSDPSAGVNWGFAELTTGSGGIYADVSYVDFAGLVLGIQLNDGDGSTQSALGLQANAITEICSELTAQAAKDGQPWNQLCMTTSSGVVLRILAPPDYISLYPNAFSTYWTAYVDQVWTQYTNQPLTIDTQVSAGNVSCQVTGVTLNCAGDNRGYAKPTAGDIFGCNSGTFAIESGDNYIHLAVVPRLCAAFNRATLLLPGGNLQPSLPATDFYTVSPTNYYSKFVHQYEVDGKGYAFSYDDVTGDYDANQSGLVSNANPTLLTIVVGGPTS
ncbi:hypothetical protein MMC13_005313 [Lambiella insularis]|nr:hypothetical protein [Lambiella insularis]